jgi:transposase-like protein
VEKLAVIREVLKIGGSKSEIAKAYGFPLL